MHTYTHIILRLGNYITYMNYITLRILVLLYFPRCTATIEKNGHFSRLRKATVANLHILGCIKNSRLSYITTCYERMKK